MITNDKAQFNLEGTRLIFRTNFSGDPKRDTGKYPNDKRKVNIIVRDINQAKDMEKAGLDVQVFTPKKRNIDDPEPEPIYYVKAYIQYRKKDGSMVKYPPRIYLRRPNGGDPILMTEDTVGQLDDIRIKFVDAVIRPWEYDPDEHKSSWRVQTMYVNQDLDTDPYYNKYFGRRDDIPEDEDF